MADLPDAPLSREEDYLASIAGQNVEVPSCPRSRKEAYLDAIDGRVEGMQEDIDELNDKVTALATDFSYKGSVDTEEDLPSDPAIGDVYTIADTGKMQVYDGENWQVLNMSGTDINVVQTTGTSTTDVMSQNAVTGMVFADPDTQTHVLIGNGQSDSTNSGIAILGRSSGYNGAIAIGEGARASTPGYGAGASGVALGRYAVGGDCAVGVGVGATATGAYSVALGAHAQADVNGQFDISTGYRTTSGYNDSNYRLLTGVYDPQSDHDAATKGYVDGLVGDVADALNVINNGGN